MLPHFQEKSTDSVLCKNSGKLMRKNTETLISVSYIKKICMQMSNDDDDMSYKTRGKSRRYILS